MDKLNQLLKEISEIVLREEKQQEERRKRGEDFNIFKVCGIDHYELQHSAIIAELLNPQGSHGQGELYLKLFMQAYGSKLPLDKIDYKKTYVKKEEWTEMYDGRMDIYVDYDGLPLIIVENKLYAKDRDIQLKKYKEHAYLKIHSSQNSNHKYEIVYLTLDGKEAAEFSGKGVDYICMSYAHDIVTWLDACIEQSVNIPCVKEILVQYKKHVKILTNQNMKNEEKEEIFGIFALYPKELEVVRDALWYDEYRQYVFDKFVKEKLEYSIHSMGLEIDYSGFPYANQFYVDKADWKRNGLRMFFGKEPRCKRAWVGFMSDHKVVPQTALESLSGDNPNEWWPYGTQFLPEGLDHWDYPCFDTYMVNGLFTEYVISKVKTILKELEKKQIMLD